MDRKELEKLARAELIAKAEGLGVTRPKTLTMPELIDEILLATERATGQKKPRGWFGRARDLLTSVVERGLPADSRRPASRSSAVAPPPLPTVTLAEIYAAQGHFERAIATLDEVIARDAGHDEAKRLRDQFVDQLRKQRPSRPPSAGEGATTSESSAVTAQTLTPELAAEPTSTPTSTSAPTSTPTTGTSAPATTGTSTPTATSTPIESGVTAASLTPEISASDPALNEGDLADRYDVDEVVAIAVDPHTVYAYWEVRAATLAALRKDHPSGALCLRVLVVPTGGASDARDVRVDAALGEIFVGDLPANAEVRVAIGWLAEGVFSPVAVGLELATPREAPSSAVAVRFGRMATGGVGETYDALRAGGLLGGGRGAFSEGGDDTFIGGAFDLPADDDALQGGAEGPGGRAGQGRGARADRGTAIDGAGAVTLEGSFEGDVAVVTRTETFRLGASDVMTRTTRELSQRVVSFNDRAASEGVVWASRGPSRGDEGRVVSFARR